MSDNAQEYATPSTKPKVIPFFWFDWEGRNRFYCNGKIMLGPQGEFIAVFSAHFIIWLGIFLCSIFEVPFFWTRVSPTFSLFHIFLFLLTWVLLTTAELLDPGIILKGNIFEPQPEDPNIKTLSESQTVLEMSENAESINTALNFYKYRWCETCYIWRPPKSSHCGMCNNCVKRFDQY